MAYHLAMKIIVHAAAVYTLTVFATGFALGAFRVLVLAPRVGEGAAVLVELPVILAASYLVARSVLRHWRVPRLVRPRLLMGALAFALLMVCELFVSLALFGSTWDQHLAQYGRPVAWLGLAGQLVFAAIPVLLLARVRD